MFKAHPFTNIMQSLDLAPPKHNKKVSRSHALIIFSSVPLAISHLPLAHPQAASQQGTVQPPRLPPKPRCSCCCECRQASMPAPKPCDSWSCWRCAEEQPVALCGTAGVISTQKPPGSCCQVGEEWVHVDEADVAVCGAVQWVMCLH